jgi:hypothetical protein
VKRRAVGGLAVVAAIVVAVVAIVALSSHGSGSPARPALAGATPRGETSGREGPGILVSSRLATRSYPRGAPDEQTDPTVSPALGGAESTFELALTDRAALGAGGSERLDYRIAIAGARPACAAFTELARATLGKPVRVALAAPTQLGWCVGAHRGTVLLEANPNCTAPVPGQAPCRLFATRFVDVGHFGFVVR